MTNLSALFGYPPTAIGASLLVACALLWGLRGRWKTRPYLLALQATFFASLAGSFLEIIITANISLLSLIENFLNVTMGQLIMFWFAAWIIIRLVFAIRFRNKSTNIFTRNRSK